MLSTMICFWLIGAFIGFMFTLFLINFDGKWKVFLESIFSIGGSGISIVSLCNFFKISEQSQKFYATIGFVIGFFVSVIVALYIMCKLIRDKDDTDIIRIRDILLGQKSYIEKYYEKRKAEIDVKLPNLESRENEIIRLEKIIEDEKKYIRQEKEKLEVLGRKKLKFILPEKKAIVLNDEFIDSMPSYISDLSKCIYDLKNHTKSFIEKEEISRSELYSYFTALSLFISQDFFGGVSKDIRVHFRLYNESSKLYEKIVAISGSQIVTKNMTPIPYEGSMIEKSYECKRALIKSINSTYDFSSNNNTVWKDYMTYTFYNLKRNDIPYLTFGISVKNETRFKNLFYFLNYFRIEEYLEEYIESVNERFKIEDILYNKEGGNFDENIKN